MGARHDLQANPNDPYISRKTPDVTSEKSKPVINNVIQSEKKNVLNGYRVSTYVFTLCALKKDDINDPKKYRNSALDLIILKSGGKGTQGIKSESVYMNYTADQAINARNVAASNDSRRVDKSPVADKAKPIDSRGQVLLSGFNNNSPGRFDLFIDNVEIDTLMTFTKDGGSTLPCTFKFSVTEPYSINGFIEALHITAVAAGYPNYTAASFLLKMEFIGYPDDDTTAFKGPRIIDRSTRYFPIKFTGIEVSVNERGTVYNCAAINWSDAAFGQPNILKRPITMSGNSVSEILKNFAKNLNEQTKEDDKKIKTGDSNKDSDEYEIAFPVRTESGFDYNKVNNIGNSTLNSILKSNAIFQFKNLGESPKTQTPQQKEASPEEVKLHPTTGTPPIVQFAEKQQINEIISAVVRDSEYVKNILKENKIDDSGFIEYFAIKADVFNKESVDSVSRKPFQRFRFSIIPYKVHFTKIPSLAGQKYNSEKLTKMSLREYNYIYTGNNVDVLNFKLNFNSLFFESIPVAMGNNDQPGSRDTAGQPNITTKKIADDNIENQKKDQVPTPSLKPVALPVVMDGANASQRSDDPYYNLARNMHSAIIDSKASMLTGDIEILGDPVYLVTGGIGNYDPAPDSIPGFTTDGEVDHLQGEVLVTVNFRNPIDIRPLEKGGMFYFQTEKLPFSGIYRVTRVINTFNDGVFKQKLEIIRYPGQIVNGEVKETVVAEKTKDDPKALAQVVQTTTKGENQGNKPASETNLFNMLLSGLPVAGLPSALSNLTGAVGNLGGQVTGLLTQVNGAVAKGLAGVAAANSVFSSSVDQLSSGIRLKASGLIDSQVSNFGGSASLLQAAKTIQSVIPSSGALDTITSDITNKAKSLLNSVSVSGSGIGEGAKVLVNKVSSLENSVSQSIPSAVPTINLLGTSVENSLSLVGDVSKNLGTNAMSVVASLGEKSSSLISSVGNKVTALNAGLPSDPAAVASKFGISPDQLSGLSGNIKSKVLDQIESVSKKIPEDVNLGIATAKGLALKFIPVDKLENIPATAPYLTSPTPEVDQKFLTDIINSGGTQALANAFGVSNINSISGNILPSGSVNSLISQVTSGIKNPLTGLTDNLTNFPDVAALTGKLTSANQLINSASLSSAGSVESAISSIASKVGNSNIGNLSNSVIQKFGSNSSGSSPLDKLFGNKG